MRVMLAALLVLIVISSGTVELKETVFQGKWINKEYHQAILEKKSFSERSKLSFNFLKFEKGKVFIEFRFEQHSGPERIHYLNKEKTSMKAMGFQFDYDADTIFMKSRDDKVLAKFIRYVR